MPATDPVEMPLTDFRTRLADCINVVARGGTVIVTSHGRPVARLVAPEPARRIAWGALKGRIHMAEDFDQLPADIIDVMESGAL